MKSKYHKVIDLYFKNHDIARNNANFVRSISNLEGIVVGEVLKDYFFDVVAHDIPIKTLHNEGWAYLHQTFKSLSPYSYTGKNVLIFKVNNEIKMMSFEDAYEYFDVDEILVDSEKEVYQKDLTKLDVQVLDRNGWTKVTKITKKKRTKDIVILKTRHSEIIEITEDHPVIIGEDCDKDVIYASEVIPYKHKQFKISLNDKLEEENIFGVNEIDMADFVDFGDYYIYSDYIMKRGKDTGFIKRRIRLTGELGYLIGYILAEGYVDKTFTKIVIENKDKELLEVFLGILFTNLGVVGYLKNKGDVYALEVRNVAFYDFVKLFAEIDYYADGKHLSKDILKYSKEFIAGIIAGIIDGDGTLGSNGQINIRLTSGKLIYQLSYLLRLLGYYPTISYCDNKVKDSENNELTKTIKQRRDIYALMFTVRKFSSAYELPSIKFTKALDFANTLDRNTIFYKENEWVNVHSVKKINNPLVLNEIEYVYDITTESHTFALHNIWVHNCVGLSAKDVAMFGLQSNAKNERKAKPPKRLETLFMQCANLICLIAQEISGATSLNDISTIGASYLYFLEKEFGLKYDHHKLVNIWQEFLYNINLPFRVGMQSPFSNITLEFGKPNPHLANEYVVFAGQVKERKYKDIPSEYYNRVVDAFVDAMSEGDADGKPFTFPLITVNIYDDFDWDNPIFKKLLEKSEYFGGLYFQNYMTKPFTTDSIYKQKNKFLEPFDIGMIYSNCCYYPTQEMFVYKNGKVLDKLTIEEFFNKYKGNLIRKDNDEKKAEWYELSDQVYVPALNLDTGKIEPKRVSKLLKIKSDKLVTVVLRNGAELKCEPTHPFIVFDFENGRLVRKFAKDLTIADVVPVTKDLNSYELVKVESIKVEELDYEQVFYDIEVEDNHTFVLANGIIGSNCRMTFNIDDVLKYTGSNPFHSNSGIGGIGVFNINMNRILFLAKDNFEYFKKLFDYIYEIGVKTLQRKRQFIREHWEDLYPYLSFYQKTDKSLFNIISVVGTHEGLINAGFKDGLKSEEGKEYAIKLATYIREKIEQSIEKYGELFNLEYAPSENAGCRLAEKDLAFANRVAKYLSSKDISLSEDEYLDRISKYIIDSLKEDIFNKVAIE